MIEAVYGPLFFLTVEILSPRSEDYGKAEEHIKEFVTACNAFSGKYSDAIEKALLCGKKV